MTSFIDWSLLEDTRVVYVDFTSLHDSPILAKELNNWPFMLKTDEIASDCQPVDTRQFMRSLGLAVHTVTSDELYGSPVLGNKPINNPSICSSP